MLSKRNESSLRVHVFYSPTNALHIICHLLQNVIITCLQHLELQFIAQLLDYTPTASEIKCTRRIDLLSFKLVSSKVVWEGEVIRRLRQDIEDWVFLHPQYKYVFVNICFWQQWWIHPPQVLSGISFVVFFWIEVLWNTEFFVSWHLLSFCILCVCVCMCVFACPVFQ